MISCKNVAKLLMSDGLAAQSRWKRMEVRLHLAMCKFCSRLERQIKQIRAAARSGAPAGAEAGLEERLIGRISGR